MQVSNISLVKAKQSKIDEVNFDHIPFGKIFTDHMLVADYRGGEWKEITIMPYGDLQLSPAISVLHYGQAIFEGLKAYKNTNTQEVYLFRPEDNFARFNISAERMCMPKIPREIFMSGIQSLIDIDRGWIPSKTGCSLYVRPFMIATDMELGLRHADNYKFMVLLSPAEAYYNEPVKVKIETHFTRAATGGTGFAKAAGNYAGSLYPAKLAQEAGYHQLLWTDAKEHRYIEEAGTMNIFFLIDGTLITAPTGDTILKGITRDSVIHLAKEWGVKVEERMIDIPELIASIQKGKLMEAFGAGTAATIAQIAMIHYEGKDYHLPDIAKTVLSQKILNELNDIKYGRTEDRHGWLYKI